MPATINLSAMTDDEINALSDADLRAALIDAGVKVGIKVKGRAALLALLADLLGSDAPPPTVPTAIKGIRVYREHEVAVSRARAAMAALPTYARPVATAADLEGLDPNGIALASIVGARPVGGKRDVWAPLGERTPGGCAAPGKVQQIARWLIATVATRPIALARPVRLVVKSDGATGHALDRIKAAPFGGIDLAPAANADGSPGAIVGFTPRAVVNGGALAIVKAAGVPGVTHGITVSAAIEKITAWAVGWTPAASADDGAGVTGDAWNTITTIARVAWGEKITGDARAALGKGARAGAAHRLGAKAADDAERDRLVQIVTHARGVKREKLAPIA